MSVCRQPCDRAHGSRPCPKSKKRSITIKPRRKLKVIKRGSRSDDSDEDSPSAAFPSYGSAYPTFGSAYPAFATAYEGYGDLNPSFLIPGFTYDQAQGVNLVDSAATWCMAGTRAMMSNVRSISPQDITGVTNSDLKIDKAGDMEIPVMNWERKVNHWNMPNTLLTPSLGIVNLLALNQILEAGYEAVFTTTDIEIYKKGNRGQPVACGRKIRNGLWLLNPFLKNHLIRVQHQAFQQENKGFRSWTRER